MAEKYFLGGAPAVAQVTTATVGGTLNGETFELKISNIIIASHTDSDTIIASTVAALVTAWNNSIHPWATGITATDTSPSVTLTADIIGVPFVVNINVPGASATFDLGFPTINQGPHVLTQKENWDSVVLPVPGDNLHFRQNTSVLWDLAGMLTVFNDITFYASASSARFGLNSTEFAINSDGTSVHSSGIGEYRQTSLFMLATGSISIGKGVGLGQTRLVLDNLTTAGVIEVFKTNTSVDQGKAAIRIDGSNTFTDINIRSAVGGVGIGTDIPNDATTVRDIKVAGDTTTKVFVDEGTVFNSFTQANGISVVASAVDVSSITVNGGTLTTEGDDWAITTLNVKGSTTKCIVNHDKIAGDSVATANVSDNAFLDLTKSSRARSVSTVNLTTGGRFQKDPNVTVTALNSATGAQNIA